MKIQKFNLILATEDQDFVDYEKTLALALEGRFSFWMPINQFKFKLVEEFKYEQKDISDGYKGLKNSDIENWKKIASEEIDLILENAYRDLKD